jgi:tetratricopeptide (TPR) repeat protein
MLLSAAEQAGDTTAAIAGLRALTGVNRDDTTLGGLLAERLATAGRLAEAAQELARLARAQESANNLEAAAALYTASIGLDAADPTIARRAADLAAFRGDHEEARRLYVLVADRDPLQTVSALVRAAALSPLPGRVELLRRAIDAAPEHVAPRERLIQALVGSGQAVQAAAESAALAEVLAAAGDRTGALTAIDQARKLDPWNPGLQTLREALAGQPDG